MVWFDPRCWWVFWFGIFCPREPNTGIKLSEKDMKCGIEGMLNISRYFKSMTLDNNYPNAGQERDKLWAKSIIACQLKGNHWELRGKAARISEAIAKNESLTVMLRELYDELKRLEKTETGRWKWPIP